MYCVAERRAAASVALHSKAVRVNLNQPFRTVLPAGRSLSGGPYLDETDRSSISGHTVLRVAQDSCLAEKSGLHRKPETSAETNASDGTQSYLPPSTDE